jgi:hypothetical protein
MNFHEIWKPFPRYWKGAAGKWRRHTDRLQMVDRHQVSKAGTRSVKNYICVINHAFGNANRRLAPSVERNVFNYQAKYRLEKRLLARLAESERYHYLALT